MEKVDSSQDLMDKFQELDKDHSVCQVFIPGRGRFTIVLQEEDTPSVQQEIENDPELTQMIRDSRKAYRKGDVQTTSELNQSLSPKDFER